MTIPMLTQAPLAIPTALGIKATAGKLNTTGAAPQYGLTIWFSVKVANPTGQPGDDLGDWSSCGGLGVQLETKVLRSGGEHGAPYLYPEDITYPAITLERAMTADSAKQVRAWLTTVAQQWIGSDEGGASMVPTSEGGKKPTGSGYRGTTVTITLYTSLPSGKAPDAGPDPHEEIGRAHV